MNVFSHHSPTESSLYLLKLSALAYHLCYLNDLNGFLIRKYFRHGVFIMNLLDLLRARIIENFPDISADELEIRVEYAHALIKHFGR